MKAAKTLRIGYFGDGPWAHDALRLLLSDAALKVVFVAPRFQNPDPVLTSIATGAGAPIFRESNVNAPESLEKIAAFKPDLLVSMSYDQIIRKALIEAAPRGFINCHAGKLPFYRGRNILNWALINGEKDFGITVHYIDEGIDTGPILDQEIVPIGPEDDYASVLRKAQDRCGKVLYRAIDKIRKGRSRARIQSKIHPVGFYCGRRRNGDETIDWNWPSKRVHDFVRAITAPSPGARTRVDGREIAVMKTSLIPKAPSYIGRPGEVVGRTPDSVVVKTGDSTVRILAIADIGADGLPGASRPPKFKIGERLGPDQASEIARLSDRVAVLERRLEELSKR